MPPTAFARLDDRITKKIAATITRNSMTISITIIDVEKHINAALYKEALDELQQKEPDNKRYKEFAERYVKYNQ